MAQITVTIPDAWALEIAPYVSEYAEGVSGHNICKKVLTAWGKTFEELNASERAELVCVFSLWLVYQRAFVESEANEARQTAAQSAIDGFTP